MSGADLDIHPDMYATTGEAARLLGVSPSTLRRWARQGHVRHLTDPNGWRLYRGGDIDELNAALNEGREAAR
ncbi:MerR family transcriptional regulator [Halostreptopolyspora alba]|uniref:MerR family DNA-binding transcriptional regulator n=1 Tax=Halostreptopolyspora alba TaxID=2487137 RepID=A0A3N0E7M9_9ACTN|nr:MerR family DNA-binding transcriptional regulator [Nocardiopsaceae bacterium YIM 96095]